MKLDTYLFKDLEIVFKKHEFLNSKNEKFNIFSILYKEHDERRLHSRFIASLLDPFGSHNMSFAFLNEFLKIFESDLKSENFNSAIVYPQEWDKRENNNIDILVIDKKTNNAIIIENKIYAGDSNNEESGQLERYFKHVRDKEKIPCNNITTYYLSLDGREPSSESIGEFKELANINCKCISYPEEIICWLDNCIKYVVDKPFIREAIIQYKNLINKMTQNNLGNQERIEIRDTIGRNEINMKSAKYLIDNFKHVKWHTVFDFCNELSEKLENNGFEIVSKPTDNEIRDLTHYETYRHGQKDKQDCGIKFKKKNDTTIFWIWNEADEWLFWGLMIMSIYHLCTRKFSINIMKIKC